MGKLKIHWASGVKTGAGNAYGYFVHNEMLKKYTSEIAELTEDSNNALFIVSPEYFNGGIPGKKNFLFSMFEGTTLPSKYFESIKKADHIITPSTWVKEMFSKYFPAEKISVVNHGVDKMFALKKRKFPKGRPFRFLWLGAHNPRKGHEEIAYIWQYAGWLRQQEVELYIKTTTSDKLERKANVIFDSRNLSRKELIKLYHSAHCFIFPTRGEGFGLTLAEAMATGLPCVSPMATGVTDFFNAKVGYPVGHTTGKGIVKFVGDGLEEETELVFPNVDEISMQMQDIYRNYEKARKIGIKASRHIKANFTWQRSAQTLVDIIEEHGYAN